MAIRIGFGTDFVVKNERVGINTDNPDSNLQVVGDFKSEQLLVQSGLTSITSFDGYLSQKLTTSDDLTLDVNSELQSLSGEIIIEDTLTVSAGTTVTSGVDDLTITDSFTLPGMNDDKPTVGTIRFNENLAALEFYTGVEWKAVNSQVDVNGGGSRAIISGGYGDQQSTPQGQRKEIQYFNTATQGNTQYFGDLTDYALPDDSAGNTIRVVNSHGTKAGIVDIIDYVTIAHTGDAIDFGDTTGSAHCRQTSVSSSTRGIWAGGKTPSTINVIEYVEIMTTGDAIDFGDLTTPVMGAASGMSPTRGVIAGGYRTPANAHSSDIETITMASKGNSTSWGNLSYTGGYGDGCSNQTRALFAGGYGPVGPFRVTNMSALTIASGGQAFNFGDLHVIKAFLWGAATGTRGFFGGGNAWPSQTHYNTIEYVSMHSLGNPIDFGDMTTRAYAAGGITNAHGGLGGF